jgi:uncharacterized protein YraI
MQTCGKCGTPNRDSAHFCANCAAPLATGASGVTGLLSTDSILQNRYVIVAKIGQGGMGAVYRAHDLHLPGKEWAIKELSPTVIVDPLERQNAKEALRREFDLLAKLNHTNLPHVADLFEECGNQYLVMDYVQGRTLEETMQQAPGVLSESVVIGWADQLCDVLGYLHRQEPPIIFRDLKPANIILEPGGTLKLIDFGIARFFQPGKTRDTAAYGTMGYAAPEQFGTGQTDVRSDVYSLGVTLHRLLTRYDPAETPFRLPPARSLNPQVSEETEHVIARATESAPVARYASIAEMKHALHPVAAAPEPLLHCDKCGQADHTLRVTVFIYVISIVVMTFKRGWAGLLCRNCRIKYGAFFFVISALFGWWGIPWGIIYTLMALVTDLIGGDQPKDKNAALLSYQGLRLLERGDAISAYKALSASYALQPEAAVEEILNAVKALVLQQAPSTRLQVPGTQSSAWKWVLAGGAVALIATAVVLALARSNPGTGTLVLASNSPTPVPTLAPSTRVPAIAPTHGPETATPGYDAEATTTINLYAGPGYSYLPVGRVPTGTTLRVTGRDSRGNEWVQVETSTRVTGWVMTGYLKLNISLEGVPTVIAEPVRQVTAIPATTIPSNSSKIVTAVMVWEFDLRSGPDYSFDKLGTITLRSDLFVLGRDGRGGDWVWVQTPSGKRGWVTANVLKIDAPLSQIPTVIASSIPTLQASSLATTTPVWVASRTPIASPVWVTLPSPTATLVRFTFASPTLVPQPKVCPPNPALVQINNYLETGLVLEFAGPTTADVYVPPQGSVHVCIGQGMYSYTVRAIGYQTKTVIKEFTQDPSSACTHWDWWPANGSIQTGDCSQDASVYYAP